MQQFLPVSKTDMKDRGIDQLDFVYVCGDAYVDHPSFGAAIICRILELHGYSVGIIPQPDWKDDNSINVLGEPRLGFFVSAGNMDSMVNHYSVSKHHRDFDNYSPGGKINLRPDYAPIVYCNLIRHTYKTKPIIIGGIEASLRRLAHYDYWSNKIRRSILLDSGADLILGWHSHIPWEFEMYKGKYIFYSLGNFLFDQWWWKRATWTEFNYFYDADLKRNNVPTYISMMIWLKFEKNLMRWIDIKLDQIEFSSTTDGLFSIVWEETRNNLLEKIDLTNQNF